MNRIEISNDSLAAVVYPDYGGMVGRLTLGDIGIFHLDEARLSEGAVLAGGNPVLFPFAGRTEGDRYELYGRTYRMPFHGLVRDSAFGVERREKAGVTLIRTGCAEWREDCYPFDFALRLEYALEGSELRMTARVANRDGRPMPHAFGWHPYFTTTDKTRARLTPNMARCERWGAAGKTPVPAAEIELARPADYVFSGRTDDVVELISPADHYGARVRSDAAFRALVVCAKFDGTTCVEPWMGLPGAINARENLQWVAPHREARYDCLIEPFLLP